MKKRLLSAALALAMALTLLPVSVMPVSAVATDKDTAAYYATENTTITGTDWDGPGWYATHVTPASGSTPASTTYSKIISGYIVGNIYYSNIVDSSTGKLRSTSFTAIGSGLSVDAGDSTSLTIDIYNGPSSKTASSLIGTSITVSGNKLTSLTVNDSKYATEVNTGIRNATENRGSVTLTAFANVTDRAITNLSLSDVVSNSGISLKGKVTSGTTTTPQTNNVTLTNAKIGTIAMGDSVVNATTQLTTYASQRLTANRRDTQVRNAPGNEIGQITMIGSSQVTLWDTTLGANTVSITGAGSTLTVEGNTTGSGAITLVASTNSKTTSGTVTANINGTGSTGIGKIQGDSTNEQSTSNFPITVRSDSKVAGIDLTNAAITVNDATVSPGTATATDIKLKNGSLAIQNGATVGGVQFQENGSITGFSVTGGGNTVGAVSISSGNTTWGTNAVNIEANNTNNIVSLALGNYSGHGVKGGTFGTNIAAASQKDYLDTGMAYQLKTTGNKFQYFPGTSEGLSSAIAAGGVNAANGNGNLVLLGTDITTPAAISAILLQDGSTRIANIGYTAVGSSVVLPRTVNGVTYESWTVTGAATGSGSGNEYKPGDTFTANTVQQWILNAQASAGSVTKITTAANKTATEPNKNVTVKLNGNAITLSGGARDSGGGSAVFRVELTTDLVDKDGTIVKPEIGVNWNGSRAVFDRESNPGYGITFPDENTLRLSNGTTYTVNASGLHWMEGPGVFSIVADSKLVVTVTDPNYKTEGQKNGLITTIVGATPGTTSSSFAYATSPALNQAVNAVAATITESQVNNWRTTAQRAAWQAKKGNIQAQPADLTGTGFTDVELQVYLAVTVTKATPLTMNLVPSYRIVVKNPGSGDFNNALMGKPNTDASYNYVAQTGTLGTLASDLTAGNGTGGAVVKLAVTGATWAHQDSTYGYQNDSTNGITITHAGRTGLGTVVLDTNEPVVKLTRQSGAKHPDGSAVGTAVSYYYDSLQAAVDDTLPQPKDNEDKIEVGSGYTGNGAISVTGLQRIFKIETKGNTIISAAASGDVTVNNPGQGHEYTIQLLKDNVTTTSIVVSTASNGSITTNAVSAKPGDVITITATPNQGYKVNTITAATNTGAAVAVSATGTLNQYTLTVPANTTKVTVTPTFVVGDNKATFSVNSNTRGTASVYTGTSDGKVEQGKSATVTVIPTSGNRTMGLTAYGNNGATAPVSRTGTNSFNVTVPSGATTVTVTPSFDVDNGTPFSDVLSNHWASNEISWAYRHGYTSGKDTAYTYKPADYITRGEVVAMLWKAANSPVVNYANPFKDVPTNYWAYNAVMWAASKGLIDTSTGYFNGTGYINRADTVVILYKHANSPTVYGTSGFADVASNAYYSRAVTWARQQGLTNGYSGNTYFRPSYAISRAEVATFLYRAFA